MIVRKAEAEELEQILAFYGEVVDSFQGPGIGWKRGVYPTGELLKGAIRSETLYIAVSGEEVLGALILSRDANAGYKTVSWKVQAEPSRVSVIHTLAIAPQYQGKGLGKEVLREVLRICRERNDRAVRLDVMSGNLRAARLYRSAGFYRVAAIEMFYGPTGRKEFELYEYAL